MNTVKKIFFFILNLQKLEKLMQNTSYYVQRMTEFYFPLKIPIISNTTTSFSPKKQPRGTNGPVPAK